MRAPSDPDGLLQPATSPRPGSAVALRGLDAPRSMRVGHSRRADHAAAIAAGVSPAARFARPTVLA
jgi:hypothetical protein